MIDHVFSVLPLSAQHMSFNPCCVQNPTGDPRSCLRSMSRSPNSIRLFSSKEPVVVRTRLLLSALSMICFLAQLSRYTAFACLGTVMLTSSGQLIFKTLIILPSSPKACQLGSVIPRPFFSQKTAPAGTFPPRRTFPDSSPRSLHVFFPPSCPHRRPETRGSKRNVLSLQIVDVQGKRKRKRYCWFLLRRTGQLASEHCSLTRLHAKSFLALQTLPGTFRHPDNADSLCAVLPSASFLLSHLLGLISHIDSKVLNMPC